jgi:hypothetical protein
MVRMIVSLPEREKRWLESSSRRMGVSAAELVRRAVSGMRTSEPILTYRTAVRACAGTWRSARGDSQEMVNALRRGWDRAR